MRSSLLLLVAVSLSACDENVAKEWADVAPGAVDITVTADGRFLGMVGSNAAGSARGIAVSGNDPTKPWTLVPDLESGVFAGTSTRRPLVFSKGRVFVAKDGTFKEIGAEQLQGLGTLLAVDSKDRWIVRQPDGTLVRMGGGMAQVLFQPSASEAPVVAPDGRVFAVNVATGDDLIQFEGGARTPLLGKTGCGADAECKRFVRLVGFDDDGGVYVSVIPADSDGGIPLFRYEGGTWTKLPLFDHPGPEGQIACGVSGTGAVFCMSDEDFGNKLYRLGRGATEWNDLGLVPTTSACNVQPRNDGRIAMRCGALSIQSGNSELFVTKN